MMTANPKASEQAVNLLQYLSSLPDKDDQRVLSGQFIRWNFNAGLDEINSIKDKTGKWVAIAAGDYFSNDQIEAHVIDYSRTNRVLMEYAELGSIVSISIHANNPINGDPAWNSLGALSKIIDPETAAHGNLMDQLEQTGDGLKEFADKEIPVLFRPFHEMNGTWFWWGGKDPEEYKQLWKIAFDYLTCERELNNLLWVYSPSVHTDQLTYYPGDEYVDIVGFDAYTPELDKDGLEAYEQLLTTGKTFAITEYGPCGLEPPKKPFDYSKLIGWIKETLPRTTFFIAWRDHWGLNENDKVKELLEDPWVVNQRDLPKEDSN